MRSVVVGSAGASRASLAPVARRFAPTAPLWPVAVPKRDCHPEATRPKRCRGAPRTRHRTPDCGAGALAPRRCAASPRGYPARVMLALAARGRSRKRRTCVYTPPATDGELRLPENRGALRRSSGLCTPGQPQRQRHGAACGLTDGRPRPNPVTETMTTRPLTPAMQKAKAHVCRQLHGGSSERRCGPVGIGVRVEETGRLRKCKHADAHLLHGLDGRSSWGITAG